MDENTVTLKFTPESLVEVKELAQRMNTTVEGVISKALALLKVSQGKTIILKQKGTQTALEITQFSK